MSSKLDTLLMCYPLRPPTLLQEVEKHFKTVLNYPQRAGNDYSSEPLPLPPSEAFAQADVMVVFSLPKNLTHIDQAISNLKLIQLVGAGYNHITQSEFWKSIPESHPLILSNATGIHVRSIAEHVIMYILALTHKLNLSQELNKQQRWPAFSAFDQSGLFIREMADMTVGILGYGHLGRECSRLASSFGSRIIACSREGAPKSIKGYLIPGTGDVDAKLPEKWFKTDTSSLQDFLAECDVVVNCLPHSTQTHHIIGEAELKIMKNDSIFINIGRGQTVDQVALVKALKAEPTTEQGALKIGAAGLDVTDPEPLPDGHELFTMPNVILTAHTSFASQKLYSKAVEILCINKERLEAGLGAINAVRGKGE